MGNDILIKAGLWLLATGVLIIAGVSGVLITIKDIATGRVKKEGKYWVYKK